jgi:hypothetical protein
VPGSFGDPVGLDVGEECGVGLGVCDGVGVGVGVEVGVEDGVVTTGCGEGLGACDGVSTTGATVVEPLRVSSRTASSFGGGVTDTSPLIWPAAAAVADHW